jgi:hypothetical protein
MTLDQQTKGADLLKVLAQKAWENAAFKEQLINNPIKTIEGVMDKNLEGFDKKFIVEDQTNENVIYFNIPAQPRMNDLELTEEELEQIAGGATPAVYVVGCIVGIGVCALVSWARS